MQRVRIAVKWRIDGAIPIADGRRAVDVDWRPDSGGDLRQRYAIANQVVVPAGEAGRQGGLWQRDTLFYSTHMTPEPGDAVEALIQRKEVERTKIFRKKTPLVFCS